MKAAATGETTVAPFSLNNKRLVPQNIKTKHAIANTVMLSCLQRQTPDVWEHNLADSLNQIMLMTDVWLRPF